MQPGGWCCRLQVAAAPPGALGLARPCLAGQQQDLHITTLCTYATVLRWRHTLKLSLFESVGQELMIRQRKLGLCGGLRIVRIVLDWGWLNSTRDGSNWIYMGVKGFVTITSWTRYLHNRTIYFGSEGFYIWTWSRESTLVLQMRWLRILL